MLKNLSKTIQNCPKLFKTQIAYIASSRSDFVERGLPKMTSLEDIANIQVTKAGTNEKVEMQSFWRDQPCVLFFMRRFGCALCRLGAQDLNVLAPKLKDAGVRFVGIGLEKLGMEEFMEGKYFDGELYIDEEKKNYTTMKYHKYNALTIIPALVSGAARAAMSRVHQQKIPGNFKGDGFQSGGLMVVSKGGDKILFEFRQNNFAEHPANEDIMKSLGLDATDVAGTADRSATCATDACELPPQN